MNQNKRIDHEEEKTNDKEVAVQIYPGFATNHTAFRGALGKWIGAVGVINPCIRNA
ncbi:MAG: hypothetical protein ABW101_16265 [Candidatus Thiodiazotropha sp.]